MSLNPVKVGTTPVNTQPTPTQDTAVTTDTTTQKSGAATFFKGIGKAMASVVKSIGEGIANLAPKHKPTSESLSPGSKAAFAEYRALLKKQDKLEKLENPTPAQQAKLQEVKDELKAARAEVKQHLKNQFYNSPLYLAAQNEPNKTILNDSKNGYDSSDPAESLRTALGNILGSPKKFDALMKSGLKIDQAVAINLYSDGAYSGINRELRSGKPGDFIQQVAASVTAGLARLPPFEEPVYRVVSLPPFIDKQYHEGATVSDTGLLSTTYNVDFDLFGGGTSHVLSIVGHGDSAGRDISWISQSPHEKEVLFPPGTEFVVKQRDQAEMPAVIGKTPDGRDKFDSTVGLLLVQKPK
jgi:hypothetical protein